MDGGVVDGAKKVIADLKDALLDLSSPENGKPSNETILRLLKADHDEIRSMLESIDILSGRSRVRRSLLLVQLETALLAHARAEEVCFYEVLKRKASTREEAFGGYEEHHLADVIFAEMHALEAGDPRWSAKFRVLKEFLEHHIAEEESGLFRDAEAVMSRQQFLELGACYVAHKARRSAAAKSARARDGVAPGSTGK